MTLYILAITVCSSSLLQVLALYVYVQVPRHCHEPRTTKLYDALDFGQDNDTYEGQEHPFLAHLSQRLIGELIGYPWSGVRPSSVVRRPSVVNNFKRLLLQNRWSDQSQILCGASLGRGNDILFAASGSHDQDGRHAHIW